MKTVCSECSDYVLCTVNENKMAEEDEIDIVGDFSFNSCFAQNNQGIPSCSDREDTVHPQWLLDSTANNWYDLQSKDYRVKDGPSRKLSGNNATNRHINEMRTTWSQTERELLKREMAKYGRNIFKISQTITTKTEAEIQALIEAEYGVHLDTPSIGLAKVADQDGTPAVVQEEIVAEEVVNMNDVLGMVTTGSPTVSLPSKVFRRKNNNIKTSKKSLLKPSITANDKTELLVNPSDLVYDDDIVIGSTQSIGSEVDKTDLVARNLAKQQKERIKALKKIGNHRRKLSQNHDKGKSRNRSKETLKSPQGRQRKDSSLSEDSVKSPKMQIVFSSGQALPVSEGEQVIKIEKKSEAESDEEIDIDSDKEVDSPASTSNVQAKLGEDQAPESQVSQPVPALEPEEPIAVPLGRFEPMPKRNRKINWDGGGGCTIMHTAAGDVYEVRAEPRKERAPRKLPVHLIPCRVYNAEKPAPCEVSMQVSTLISMDVHAHTSRGEVMGLLGGRLSEGGAAEGGRSLPRLLLAGYQHARAASAHTHCDMDPVSQAAAATRLQLSSLVVCGWHHSHPSFAARPSAQDLRAQRALQRLAWRAPCLALLTSQQWPPGRAATTYRCFRVEDDDEETDPPTGYQLSVKLVADLTAENLGRFLADLTAMVQELDHDDLSVDMNTDVCPQACITYLEKCISSVSHHMRSAGYGEWDPLVPRLLQGIRDVFR